MSKEVSELYRFGPFQLDPRERLLLRDGTPITITPKAFDTLLVLVQNSNHLLLKDELLKAVWRDSFVEEVNLSQNVSALRRALGDTAQESRYIATIAGKGYRFVAEVKTLAAGEHEQQSLGLEEHAQLQMAIGEARLRRLRATLAGALVVLSVVAFGSYGLHKADRGTTAVAVMKPQISSIAVLPLENLSNDPEQEYFVEGMTDEIITDLAQLPGLRVISRTSTQRYKGTHKTAPEIARELNVDGVLEGTVLRADNRIRIRAQLIYAPADQHLWAEAYERDAKDVLTLQAIVARDIAGEIRLKLTPQQTASLAAPRRVDAEAHELYLKGRFYWNKRTPEGFQKALPYFEAAIQKDPSYAEAYAGLADAYRFSMSNVPPDEVMPKAKEAAEKALAINPNLAEAHASLGLIAPYYDWDWDGARRELKRAIELNPNYALAHDWYADGYLTPMGKLDESLAELRLAQQLDPLSPVILGDIGKTLYFARRYDEAITQLRALQEMDPAAYPAAIWLWKAYVEKGMFDQALDVIEKEKPHVPKTFYLCDLAYTHARMGDSQRARSLLAQFLKIRGKEDPGGPAMIYVALGEKEHAFEWLEKAYAGHSNFMSSLKVWPAYDPIRNDPRFLELERRVHLIP